MNLRGIASRFTGPDAPDWGPVALVGAAYLVVQLLVVPLDRWWSWDEAAYVSQVSRGIHAAMFYPWQSRGVSFLVAPVALLGAPFVAIRIWLAFIASIALTAAFGVWSSLVGRRVAAYAAFLFMGSWLALFYGSEAMPNLWSAACAIAATGLALRTGRRDILLTSAVLLAMALIRVSDAAMVGSVIAIVLGPIRRRWKDASMVLAGIGGGALVWLGELLVRFGSSEGLRMVVGSQRSQRFVTVVGPLRRLEAYIGWLGSNVAPPDFRPNTWSVLWWGCVLVAAAVGLRGTPLESVRLAAGIAVVVVAVYGILAGPVIPRYVLPAFGLLVFPAAVGFGRLADRLRAFRGEGARDLAVVMAISLSLAQVVGARQVAQGLIAFRGVDRILGEWTATAIAGADPETCLVIVAGNAHAIGMELPCRTRFYSPPAEAFPGQSDLAIEAARAAVSAAGEVFYLRYWQPPDPEGLVLIPYRVIGPAELFRVEL